LLAGPTRAHADKGLGGGVADGWRGTVAGEESSALRVPVQVAL